MAFERVRVAGLTGLLLFTASLQWPMQAAVSCSGIPAWSPTTTYTAGAQVTYNGGLYRALSSTTNVQPDYCPSCGWWQYVDACGTNITCTTAPEAPSGLAASGVTSSSVNLSWSAVSTPANCTVTYSIYQGSAAVLTGLTATSTPITGLAASTTYAFTVVAVDGAGSSGPSNAVTVTTSGGDTGTCAGVADWNASAVYTKGMRAVYGSKLWEANWWVQGTAPSDSPWGPWKFISDCTTITCSAAPAVPSGLSYTNLASTSLTLSWNAVTAPAGCTVSYRVYQNGTLIASPAVATSSVTNLSANTPYSFTVAAVDSFGSSSPSQALNVTTPPLTTCTEAPSRPTGLVSTGKSSSSVSLSWAASSAGADCTITYNVYRNGSLALTVPTTTATVGSLSASTPYTFTVAAVDTAGTSAQSDAISVTTDAGSTGNLTLGEVANPNGRYFAGYYPTWSDNWFSITKWDGTKMSDDEIYTASNFAKIPGVYTHVKVSFAQPNFSWNGMAANNWSGTGINFNATPADMKEVIRILHILKKKVILAVGGATYNSWSGLSAEAGVNGPIKTALANFMKDLDIDGLDVDYEVAGVDAASITNYAKAIQAMREACDAAGSGKLLTMAAWSTGADYTAATGAGPYGISYWGGDASRERQTFAKTCVGGPRSGQLIANLFDVCDLMTYDAQTLHFDPITAFDQYRAIMPSSCPVSIGLEIPPEGWAGGMLVLNNSDAGATGTFVEQDQYGRTNRGAYSVEHYGNYVMSNTVNANPHDGLMLWQILKTSSPTNANATSVAAKVAQMFGYVPTRP